MSGINVAEIARELASLSSTTDPNNWPHRAHILYKLGEYRIWAEICTEAMKLAKDEVLKIYLLIEQINALRRMPNFSIELIGLLIDEADGLINGLDTDHPSSRRLQELLRYNTALVYHLVGEFVKAAQYHKESAEAAENERSRLLALYNKAVEMLNEALMTGRGGSYYEAFEKASETLLSMLSTDSYEDKRWTGNVYWHQSMYAWITKDSEPDMEKLKYLKELSAEVKVFSDVVILLKAISKLQEKPQQALEMVLKISPEADITERAFGMLIHSSALLALGQQENAIAKLHEIVRLSECERGGRLVIAIAEAAIE